jgi:NAD(P)-dependent dehydrogenase (short-subunit alcohol dehydrogenase family)
LCTELSSLLLTSVTNFLGPFFLTALLSPFLSSSARIVQTSSNAAYFASFFNIQAKTQRNTIDDGFNTLPWLRWSSAGGLYSQSKAMQIIFANILQEKFDQSENRNRGRRRSTSYHPGVVATNIFNALNFQGGWTKLASAFITLVALTPKQGAQSALWLALSNDRVIRPGGFYERDKLITLPFYKSTSSETVKQLWSRWNADAGLEESDWHF